MMDNTYLSTITILTYFDIIFCRDEQRSQSSKDKWIPPSAFKRDALPENCDDVKFRKVREDR